MAATVTDKTHVCETISPRGLLLAPPAVAEHVEHESARALQEHGFILSADAKRRMLIQGTLDWYFLDQWVSYRERADGVEVLAVGLDEIGALAARLSESERSELTTKLI